MIPQVDPRLVEDDKIPIYAQCRNCSGWTLICAELEWYGDLTKGAACEHCGHHDFDRRSITPKGSFNPEVAKKRKVK